MGNSLQTEDSDGVTGKSGEVATTGKVGLPVQGLKVEGQNTERLAIRTRLDS